MVERHEVDFGRIFESDFATAEEQFVQIWCATHRKYEWQWIAATGLVPAPGEARRIPDPFD